MIWLPTTVNSISAEDESNNEPVITCCVLLPFNLTYDVNAEELNAVVAADAVAAFAVIWKLWVVSIWYALALYVDALWNAPHALALTIVILLLWVASVWNVDAEIKLILNANELLHALALK